MRHVLALCALIVVATGFGGAATRPSLEVQSTDPFRVRGENFGPRELVRVTGTLDGATIWISRRAGPGGRFWALLPDDACTVTVQARGDRGSRASLSFAHVTCRPTR